MASYVHSCNDNFSIKKFKVKIYVLKRVVILKSEACAVIMKIGLRTEHTFD